MVGDTIAILDYTDFFIDNIKSQKDSRQKHVILRNKNYIKYLKRINIKREEIYTEIIKIDSFMEKYEIEEFIKSNILKYELIIILKECKSNSDLRNLMFVNEKLKEKKLNVLNIIYEKDDCYKSGAVRGKITISSIKEKKVLFRETSNVYNSILNLMKNNKKILFDLCKEKNIPSLNINIIDEKHIGEGVLYIIKNFKDIQYLDVLILTLISRKKVSIEDVYYIKDPLEEYMNFDKKIIVQELVEDSYKDNLTINLIGLK